MGRSQLRLCAGIRLVFLSFMSTNARLQCAHRSALCGFKIASLVLRQTCHSRLPGAARTQFVMTIHRWLRVSVCSLSSRCKLLLLVKMLIISDVRMMRVMCVALVMMRERRGFDATTRTRSVMCLRCGASTGKAKCKLRCRNAVMLCSGGATVVAEVCAEVVW